MVNFNRTPQGHALDAEKDLPDVRDRYYQPQLLKLAGEMPPPAEVYTHIRDQKREGACTGFALAAAIDMLNQRRLIDDRVSTRMLYTMAKRYDEWSGELYEGSSLRGAIRGWWHNGVCPEFMWPYEGPAEDCNLTVERAKQAKKYSLGAYYRLRPNLVDFHCALNEVGVICVSAKVHSGWMETHGETIEYQKDIIGGHAFAIVGYNADGFWVQNSWGTGWGKNGVALWTYDDWAENLMDAWVFRMAAPYPRAFHLRATHAGGQGENAAEREAFIGSPRRHEIAGHYLHLDDGKIHEGGRYPSTLDDVRQTASHIVTSHRQYKHLLFYAHGGLNSPEDAARRIKAMKEVFKTNGIYPFHFMYDTGLMEEIGDVVFRRSRQVQNRVGDFFDFTDKLIEMSVRRPVTPIWDEMKRGAFQASQSPAGGAFQTMDVFGGVLGDNDIKIHVVGHSTGAIFVAHLLQAMDQLDSWSKGVSSCSLLAPACTVDLYHELFLPRLEGAQPTALDQMQIYNLTNELEEDDNVVGVYRKSLLYLVSNALEKSDNPKPILGMQRFNKDLKHDKLQFLYAGAGKKPRSRSTSHGGFDNDATTMNDLLATVLGHAPEVPFKPQDLKYG